MPKCPSQTTNGVLSMNNLSHPILWLTAQESCLTKESFQTFHEGHIIHNEPKVTKVTMRLSHQWKSNVSHEIEGFIVKVTAWFIRNHIQVLYKTRIADDTWSHKWNLEFCHVTTSLTKPSEEYVLLNENQGYWWGSRISQQTAMAMKTKVVTNVPILYESWCPRPSRNTSPNWCANTLWTPMPTVQQKHIS